MFRAIRVPTVKGLQVRNFASQNIPREVGRDPTIPSRNFGEGTVDGPKGYDPTSTTIESRLESEFYSRESESMKDKMDQQTIGQKESSGAKKFDAPEVSQLDSIRSEWN